MDLAFRCHLSPVYEREGRIDRPGPIDRAAVRPFLIALLAASLLLPAACGETGVGRTEGRAKRPEVVTIVQDDAELLHRSEEEIGKTLDDIKSLGVDWVRVTVDWAAIASADAPPPNPADPASYPQERWAAVDRVVRMAKDRGLDYALDVGFWAPRWAVGRIQERSVRQRREPSPVAFGDFSEAVARRYDDAVAFTVWNEPNHNTWLLPQWKRRGGEWVAWAPHWYRSMVYASVPRLKRAAPDALVLIGATSSLGTGQGTAERDRTAPLTFLREMACVDERLQPLDRPECADYKPLPGDGWSHHPYGVDLTPAQHDDDPDTARIGDLPRLERLLEQLAARKRTERWLPIYVTEFGYQTNPPDPTQKWSPTEQARLLPEAERATRSLRSARAFAQFLVRDLPPRPADSLRDRWRDFQTGIRYADGRPKPAHAGLALTLTADEIASDRVRFWGVIRPGDGEREATIAAATPGSTRFERVATVRTDADGVFTTDVAADPRATFRLEADLDGVRRTGPALVGARAP